MAVVLKTARFINLFSSALIAGILVGVWMVERAFAGGLRSRLHLGPPADESHLRTGDPPADDRRHFLGDRGPLAFGPHAPDLDLLPDLWHTVRTVVAVAALSCLILSVLAHERPME